jgi:hypothetical protein
VNPANVYDLKFFDANTGLICATGGIVYRTTNGGNNWVVLSGYKLLYGMEKIDSTALYAYGRNYNAYDLIYRTFNRGQTWDSVSISGSATYSGISFINRDTGWVSAFGSVPVISMTTNGGVTFIQQTTQVGWGKIFFLKYKINGGYYGWATGSGETWKTTNTGTSWFRIISTFGPSGGQFYFKDTNYGWFASGDNYLYITTNSGYNWLIITMPTYYGIGSGNLIKFFKLVSNEKIYGTYASRNFGGGIYRGIIWVSFDGGINWNFQQPDSIYPFFNYAGIDFTDSSNGWSSNIHTTNGGGPIFISGINPSATNNSANYKLEQNYPNPFNPETVIEYSIPKASYVLLKVYDLLGREILNIKNSEYLQPGNYQTKINMDKANLTGGVYFYRLTAYDKNSGIAFTEAKKLIYIK